uniref:NADH dehydrogenase subunit 2 n=1 Tax=Silvatares holzenthali TaxID=3026466 RepID=UPI0023D7FFEF|nr:NADH dehydrogenase subunit 2 [Silvatares holzenthali]WCR50256.1 NADH dehydrogenase subunit 2 [Silvatares holzenthali]
MYFNSMKYFFILLMISSTIFSISSFSFMNMWIGMEINLMSFIPLLISKKVNSNSENMMNYFLIQSISSANFLFSSILILIFSKWFFQNFFYMNTLIFFIMNISLLMKMGAAPFHFWFPMIMNKISWLNCLILSTWMKIIPMIIISYCFLNFILYLSIIMSAMIGSIMGLNQTSLKLIISYSSINHIAWMLANIMFNMNIWLIYFITYTIINFILILTLNLMKINFLKQIYMKTSNNLLNYFIFLNFLNLGGLPPFLGFLPKWLTINCMIANNMTILLMLMIFFSLVSLFFYMRITYSFLLMNFFEMKFYSHNFNKMNLLLLLNFFSLTSLMMITLINF